MKKLWFTIGFLGSALVYFAVKYFLSRYRERGNQDGTTIKHLDDVTAKNKKKMDIMYKKIEKLNKKKANNETFKDYSNDKLIRFIRSKLKS